MFSSPLIELLALSCTRKGRPVAVKPEIVVIDFIIHRITPKSIKIRLAPDRGHSCPQQRSQPSRPIPFQRVHKSKF
jgi:hypothetical protein